MHWFRKLPTFVLIATLALFMACSGSKAPEEPKPAPAAEPAAPAPPPEVAETVAAEDGGDGFTGKGWETSVAAPLGDPVQQ